MIQLIVFIIFINSALPRISTTISANLSTYDESSHLSDIIFDESSHAPDIINNEAQYETEPKLDQNKEFSGEISNNL